MKTNIIIFLFWKSMVKVFVFPPIQNIAHIPLLNPLWGSPQRSGGLFVDEAFSHYKKLPFDVTERLEEADFALFPHNYFHLKRRGLLDALVRAAQKSKTLGKPLIVYAPGDSDELIDVPNTIILRYSQYRYKKQKNEIMLPVFAGDFLGEEAPLREKTREEPVVGFCGWIQYQNAFEAAKSGLKNVYFDLRSLMGNRNAVLHKKGIYFRRKALGYLRESEGVTMNVIIRSSHSAHMKTVQGDPAELRKEYIQNILDSDLCLTVKGDGNISLRFYEVLALSRIPIFIDTDCVLPLEEIINYKEFMLYMDYRELPKIGDLAHDYFSALSPEAFIAKQRLAREIFVRYLRSDAFFSYLFGNPEYLKRHAANSE